MRGGLWLVGFLLVFGAAYQLGSQRRGAPPPPAPPAPSAPAPAAGAPRGPPAAAELDQELTRLQTAWVGKGGRPVATPPPPRRKGAKPVPYLRPDPLSASPLFGQAAGLAAFRDWLRRGGRPEEFSVADRAAYRAVDARYREAGIIPPLYPAFASTSSAADPGAFKAFAGRLPPLPTQWPPWFAAAAQAFLRARARAERMQRDLVLTSRLEEASADFPRTDLGVDFAFALTPAGILTRLRRTSRLRIVSRAWYREGSEALRHMLYALGRSLSEEPEFKPSVCLLAALATEELGPVWHGDVAFLRGRDLFPRPLAGLSGAFLSSLVDRRREEARHFQGTSRRVTGRQRSDALIRAERYDALAARPGSGDLEVALERTATEYALRAYRRAALPSRAVQTFRRFLRRPPGRVAAARSAAALREGLQAWLELDRKIFPSRTEREDLTRWVAQVGAEWSTEADQLLLGRFQTLFDQ